MELKNKTALSLLKEIQKKIDEESLNSEFMTSPLLYDADKFENSPSFVIFQKNDKGQMSKKFKINIEEFKNSETFTEANETTTNLYKDFFDKEE